MTDRERQFATLGFEYAEGIDLTSVIIVPSTGREIRKKQVVMRTTRTGEQSIVSSSTDDLEEVLHHYLSGPDGPAVGSRFADYAIVDVWECQPWNDNYWKEFTDLLDAVKFATPPQNQ